MTGRNKFFLTLCLLIFLFILFQIYLYYHRSNSQRERDLLLNQYYKLLNVDPEAAKRALLLLHQQNPHDQSALRELGYWYLRQGDTYAALNYFKLATANDPHDLLSAYELAKLYVLIGNQRAALPLLRLVQKSNDISLRSRAMGLLDQIAAMPILEEKGGYTPVFDAMQLVQEFKNWYPYTAIENIPEQQSVTVVAKQASTNASTVVTVELSARDQLLNAFYANKEKNRLLAWQSLKQLMEHYPLDPVGFKEAGYLALSEQRNALAFEYLRTAYQLTLDPMIAMQIGYILDGLHRRREAYYYFYLASKNPNFDQRYKAAVALVNLRGYQTKFLPDPFFWDTYYNPLHYSRFRLMINQIISRLGVTLNNKYQWQLYLSYRRTWDNRSGVIGALPQIYEDSTSIYAVGSLIQPFPKVPLVAFLELGKARSLVQGVQPHWRGDLRGGLAYFKDWGREAAYYFKPTYPFKYVSDLYADLIYYSRYQNWIGTARFRPGLEVVSYHTASLDLYFRGFLIQDTQREFFNNYLEYGLGAALIPNNRYNFALRYEFTQGHYLPCAGSSQNPYPVNYHNNVVEGDFFIRF